MSIVRKTAGATAIVAALGAVAIPAAASAAPPSTTTIQRHTYHIAVAPGVLAGGQNRVTVRVKVTNPESSVRRFWSRTTVKQVVRQGVDQRIQMPYMSQGFRCTPTLDGSTNASTARFTCKLQGADVPTTVTLRFKAAYQPSGG
jgi:hypothetical protein